MKCKQLSFFQDTGLVHADLVHFFAVNPSPSVEHKGHACGNEHIRTSAESQPKSAHKGGAYNIDVNCHLSTHTTLGHLSSSSRS